MSREFMPVQIGAALDLRVRRGERIVIVRQIPWRMFVSAHQDACRRLHSQSLDDIARRGGFDAVEAVCVLSCQPHWTDLGGEEIAHRILYAMVSTFNRGQRVAEGHA